MIKDWRGTAIEVGDVILYAVKHSTSVEVNEAVVREIGEKENPYGFRSGPVPFITAEWVRSSYGYMPGRDLITAWERKIKAVTLTNFEGITVVSKHTPPAFSIRPEPVNWEEPKVV
jgi:hypothetical protein